MTDDTDIAEVMAFCKKARVTVHIRGTDERPVIQLLDKGDRREVGGIELKRRLARG